MQDGPFADTKEAFAGIFMLDVPDLDAALAWAEKCPAAHWGTVEIRPRRCGSSMAGGPARRNRSARDPGRRGARRGAGPHRLRPAPRRPGCQGR